MSNIISINSAVPEYSESQAALADYMPELLGLNATDTRKLRVVMKKSGITTRHSVLPDFRNNGSEAILFTNHEGNGSVPSVNRRLELYHRYAPPLAVESVEGCLAGSRSGFTFDRSNITHLITVSCTGMSAPGLEIELIRALQLPPRTKKLAVNFMGCYAVFHALQIAHAICQSQQNAAVLIVSVELCTLHFQHQATVDSLLANSLFADGAASALVVSDDLAQEYPSPQLSIEDFGTQTLSHGEKDMAWHISEHGFLMTLTPAVPEVIEQDILQTVRDMLDRTGNRLHEINHWAIHPGGSAILSACEHALGLDANNLTPSYQVLSSYGNMSSATILFVLQVILSNRLNGSPGEKIFASGFGPGLTVEMALFTTN
ncbi:MAG TPA: type III polyketide synthase [bacterium]|nr:type III polyketide synthase [bacterium]